MQDNIFIDTNIWLYAFSDSNSNKAKIAKNLIKKSNVCLNTQILNEICFNLIKNENYTDEEILHFVKNIYKKYDVLKIDEKTILGASLIRSEYNIKNYWDSMIISSAINNECSIIYSDIIESNLNIKEIKIINPFK
ncbi:MAG TPA: PIN domain-containing protein [Spirochaetota bacterium]|nr:PIN domain-containing protein [Spirochaetota bacterium]HOL57593.1 PIN domain-containing protein [Spirochaetota bacterium]HPP04525.1 PIN domain-containing protein [Spirochaetota bacterium]